MTLMATKVEIVRPLEALSPWCRYLIKASQYTRVSEHGNTVSSRSSFFYERKVISRERAATCRRVETLLGSGELS
jgi:hypothetical protein